MYYMLLCQHTHYHHVDIRYNKLALKLAYLKFTELQTDHLLRIKLILQH